METLCQGRYGVRGLIPHRALKEETIAINRILDNHTYRLQHDTHAISLNFEYPRSLALFRLSNYKLNHNWAATWNFQQCGMCDQQSLRSACAYAQSDQSLCWSFEYYKTIKLLTEHHLEFLRFKGGRTGSSESTLIKMPHCWNHMLRLSHDIQALKSKWVQ